MAPDTKVIEPSSRSVSCKPFLCQEPVALDRAAQTRLGRIRSPQPHYSHCVNCCDTYACLAFFKSEHNKIPLVRPHGCAPVNSVAEKLFDDGQLKNVQRRASPPPLCRRLDAWRTFRGGARTISEQEGPCIVVPGCHSLCLRQDRPCPSIHRHQPEAGAHRGAGRFKKSAKD